MKKLCLLFAFSLLVALMACGREKSEDEPKPPFPPAVAQPLPSIVFEKIPLEKIPSYCERDDKLRTSEDIEALIENPNPAPLSKVRRAYNCVGQTYVTAYFDYGTPKAANRAVNRLAGRVFHGDGPVPNIRYNEVLRRDSVVVVIVGEGTAATQLAFELYREKSFEPALPGRTLLNQYFEASKQGSMLLTLLTSSGQAALDSALFFGTDLKCDSGGNPLFCEAIKHYDGRSTLPDPPRSGDPQVLWGLCIDVSGPQPREDVCWFLRSPLGVSLGKASDIEKTAPMDEATRLKIRDSISQGVNPSVPEALNEAVLDLGPGTPPVYKAGTWIASVSKDVVLHMRGTTERLIVLGTSPNTTNRRFVALFMLPKS